MKKIGVIGIGLISLVSFTMIAGILIARVENGTNGLRADGVEYGISMNSETNKFHTNPGPTSYSGSTTIKTKLNNDVSFEYSGLIHTATTWHIINQNGYIYNSTPILGVSYINITSKTDNANFRVYWSGDTNFETINSATYVSSSTSSTLIDFEGKYPLYFKIENESETNLNVSSINIAINCVDNYHNLSVSSEDENIGTVVGGGSFYHGSQTNIGVAINDAHYLFKGWYIGDDLFGDSETYQITVDSDKNVVAKFQANTHNVIVGVEREDKGTASADKDKYLEGETVTLTAVPNEHYTFEGWMLNGSLVSNQNPYIFTMGTEDVEYIATFSTQQFTVRLDYFDSPYGFTTNLVINGSFNHPWVTRDVYYGEQVTISYSHSYEDKYDFVGWYDNDDNLVSAESPYTFTMPYESVSYKAKFDYAAVPVSVSVNDETMGTATYDGVCKVASVVNLHATPNDGYSFAGWYKGEVLISKEQEFDVYIASNEQTHDYQARFVKNYLITIINNETDKGTAIYPLEVGEGLDAVLSIETEDGYGLDAWYDDEFNVISRDPNYTFAMPNHDVTLYVTFTTGHKLTVETTDLDLSTPIGTSYYPKGRSVTVKCDLVSAVVVGWYDIDGNEVSTDSEYTFTMPDNDYYLKAKVKTELNIVKISNQDGYSVYSDNQTSYNFEKVIIPQSYEGLPVLRFTIYAEYCPNLREIVMAGNNLESVTLGVQNTRLRYIFLNEGVKQINLDSSLIAVKEFKIPSSIEKFEGVKTNCLQYCRAYNGCYYMGWNENPYAILMRTVSDDTLNNMSIHQDCMIISTRALYQLGHFSTLTLPSNVLCIGERAFGDGSISTINFNENLKYIGEYAFLKNSIQSVELGGHVTYIGQMAFQNNTPLSRMILPASLTYCGSYIAHGAENLDAIYYEGTQESTSSWSSTWYYLRSGKSRSVVYNFDRSVPVSSTITRNTTAFEYSGNVVAATISLSDYTYMVGGESGKNANKTSWANGDYSFVVEKSSSQQDVGNVNCFANPLRVYLNQKITLGWTNENIAYVVIECTSENNGEGIYNATSVSGCNVISKNSSNKAYIKFSVYNSSKKISFTVNSTSKLKNIIYCTAA